MIKSRQDAIVIGWAAAGLVLAGGVGLFVPWSRAFGYDHEVLAMPVLTLVAGLMLAGLLVPALAWLSARSSWLDEASRRLLLPAMLATGLVLRLALMASEPALEDDYQRYLFDGGALVAGHNPYGLVPTDVMEADAATPLGQLAERTGVVLRRINHPEYSTIYPPVAQAAFALAHLIAPYQLWAWRLVCLAGEGATLAIILSLLARTGRDPLWAALYWWNPLMLKELANSAHMEAVLMPMVLGAVASLVAGRHALAAFALALAAGVKLWPALLLPLVLAPLVSEPRRLILALAAFVVPAVLIAAPVVRSGLGEGSGLVAYASVWKTNSVIFPLLESLMGGGLPGRVLIGGMLAGFALAVAWRYRNADGERLLRASALVCGAIFLLSPAQFPWYAAWVVVLLPLLPLPAFLALSVTMPLYYSAFHLMARGHPEVFARVVVPVEWAPVLALLLIAAYDRLRRER